MTNVTHLAKIKTFYHMTNVTHLVKIKTFSERLHTRKKKHIEHQIYIKGECCVCYDYDFLILKRLDVLYNPTLKFSQWEFYLYFVFHFYFLYYKRIRKLQTWFSFGKKKKNESHHTNQYSCI